MKQTVYCLCVCVALLTGCSSKTVTVEQAVKETVPFKVDEIIHKEELTDGAIVLYTTKRIYQRQEFTALTTAYLEGNETTGWENEGDNQWTYQPDAPIQVYYNDVYDYETTGELSSRFELTYGQVKDEKIVQIEVSEGNEVFVPLQVIERGEDRYFFAIKEYPVVRGLDESGQVVAEYKQRQR